MEPVSRPPEWLFASMWKQGERRLDVGIVDTVLFKNGNALRWLFTSKNGEVVKKKHIEPNEVRDRFVRVSTSFATNAQVQAAPESLKVCTGRNETGQTTVHTTKTFLELMKTFPPSSTSGIVAIQPCVRSRHSVGTSSVFHNQYEVKNDKGKVVTATFKVQNSEKEQMGQSITLPSTSMAVGDAAPGVVRSQASGVNTAMDDITRKIIRYVETNQKCRIMNASIDYVQDENGHLWVVWAGPSLVLTGAAATDLRLSSLPISHDGREGRAPDRRRKRAPGGKVGVDSSLGSTQSEMLDVGEMGRHLGNSLEILEPKKLRPKKAGPMTRAKEEGKANQFHLSGKGKAAAGGDQRHFPTPFRCVGDYCGMGFVEPSSLVGSNSNAEIAQLKDMFTEEEWDALESAGKLNQLMSHWKQDAIQNVNPEDPSQITANHPTMTYRSIAVDREERKARKEKALEDNKQRRALGYDTGSGGRGVPESGGRQSSKMSRLHQNTESKSLKTRQALIDKGDVDFAGASNYYRPVKMCWNCFLTYTTLDKARVFLQTEKDAMAEEQRAQMRAEWEAEVNLRVDDVQSKRNWNRSGQKSRGSGSRGGSREHQTSFEGPPSPITTNGDQDGFNGGDYSLQHSQSAPYFETDLNGPGSGALSHDLSTPSLVLPSIISSGEGGGGSNNNSYEQAPQRAGQRDYSHKSGSGQRDYSYQPKQAAATTSATNSRPWSREARGSGVRGGAQEKPPPHSQLKSMGKNFSGLDKYLRGSDAAAISTKKGQRDKRQHNVGGSDVEVRESGAYVLPTTNGESPAYCGKILIADEDAHSLSQARVVLEAELFRVDVVQNGTKALKLAQHGDYDAMLVSRDMEGLSAMELTKLLRKHEGEERIKANSKGAQEPRRLPVVTFTEFAAPEDLRLYMEAGMDGCISKPLEKEALVQTMQAAIPHHKPHVDVISPRKAREQRAGGIMGGRPGKADLTQIPSAHSALPKKPHQKTTHEIVEATLSSSVSRAEVTGIQHGKFQMDADTLIPYTVVGQSHANVGEQQHPFFNLVVCHDLFDTAEKLQIFFQPIIDRYPGAQVLLWNYPGQAFSEWRKDALLNNEYLAGCLDSLLRHVGFQGTKQFVTESVPPYHRPYHTVGFGIGGSVAAYHCIQYASPAQRGLVMMNGYTYIDPHLAAVLHDCMNVFSCSPPTRPDLPLYFWTRFLFSGAYLTQVSTPLALNLYTAVHNPITLEGRIQLCLGALSNVDVRKHLGMLHLPLIALHSSLNGLVKPMHVEAIVKCRGGEYTSINQAFKNRRKVCCIWLKAGHEVFQEQRRPVANLLEQLLSGYHEVHDVAWLAADGMRPSAMDASGSVGPADLTKFPPSKQEFMSGGASMLSMSGKGGGKPNEVFEDHFIDGVLDTLHSVQNEKSVQRNHIRQQGSGGMQTQGEEQGQWEDFRQMQMKQMSDAKKKAGIGFGVGEKKAAMGAKGSKKSHSKHSLLHQTIVDPNSPAFERQDNVIYAVGQGSKIYPNPVELPEVKEYMGWRLKRNKKRLHRLEAAAHCVQRAFRAYMARTMVQRIKMQKAAAFVQRNWRGASGRKRYLEKKQEEWACRLVQRNWRGKAGREIFLQRRLEERSASMLQRIYRGRMGKNKHFARLLLVNNSAALVQNMYRAKISRRQAFQKRLESNMCLVIQRLYRGHIGRRRASNERDKYLFSKSQSQGIEFGRQMLMEHKLQGTKLQSDVQILLQEKVATEETVEALLEEISEFEDGVRQLETEMHQLSKVETEAVGILDEESKAQLREQKMRLDKEFGSMLVKIADRKERLQEMEHKLQSLDKARMTKEEELKDLERKLVVLLEEQQNELEQIRVRQHKRGEVLPVAQQALGMAPGSVDPNTGAMVPYGDGGAGAIDPMTGAMVPSGGGGPNGVTEHQRKEANALMQSSETLMKFGFMSMSMTYFSSLNMIRAMRTMGVHETLLEGAQGGGGGGMGGMQMPGMMGGMMGGMPGAGGLAAYDTQTMKGGPASMPGMGMQGSAGARGGAGDAKLQREFEPPLRKGHMPGETLLSVQAWTVSDVGHWLDSLALSQYKHAFADAAVDGAFLYDLNDDDLKNTLGIEHGLHRKKILNMVNRLKKAEGSTPTVQAAAPATTSYSPIANEQAAAQGFAPLGGGGSVGGGGSGGGSAPVAAIQDVGGGEVSAPAAAGPEIRMEELITVTRHGKLKKLREALDRFPARPFDSSLVRMPYVPEFGTAYVDALERCPSSCPFPFSLSVFIILFRKSS
jgi:CheY-like chemotaxis protein/pimeloyl-ACP methyl ester carboxylesterase